MNVSKIAHQNYRVWLRRANATFNCDVLALDESDYAKVSLQAGMSSSVLVWPLALVMRRTVFKDLGKDKSRVLSLASAKTLAGICRGEVDNILVSLVTNAEKLREDKIVMPHEYTLATAAIRKLVATRTKEKSAPSIADLILKKLR